MAYNVLDLIDKAIDIVSNKLNIYKQILMEEDLNTTVLVRNAYIKECEKSILHYKELKSKLQNRELEEIDFVVYDKISFLINEFNGKHGNKKVTNKKELNEFTLNYEKDSLALLIDIQGRLIRKESDATSIAYEVINKTIKKKKAYIRNLKEYIK